MQAGLLEHQTTNCTEPLLVLGQERLRQAALQADIIGYKVGLGDWGSWGIHRMGLGKVMIWSNLGMGYKQMKWNFLETEIVNHANHVFFTCLSLSVNCSSSAAAHWRLQRSLLSQSWRLAIVGFSCTSSIWLDGAIMFVGQYACRGGCGLVELVMDTIMAQFQD